MVVDCSLWLVCCLLFVALLCVGCRWLLIVCGLLFVCVLIGDCCLLFDVGCCRSLCVACYVLLFVCSYVVG